MVAGPDLQRLEEDGVHQLDDRRLVGDVEDVLGLVNDARQADHVVVLDAVEQLFDVGGGSLVRFVDQGGDAGARRQDGSDGRREHARQLVHRVDVQRVAGRHLEASVGARESDQVVVARELGRDLLRELLGDLDGLQVILVVEAQHPAENLQQVSLGHEAL